MKKDRWAQRWSVVGSKGNEYTVANDGNGNWACSCIGWTRHVPRKECKHITEVRVREGRLRLGYGLENDKIKGV